MIFEVWRFWSYRDFEIPINLINLIILRSLDDLIAIDEFM